MEACIVKRQMEHMYARRLAFMHAYVKITYTDGSTDEKVFEFGVYEKEQINQINVEQQCF